MRPTRTSSWTTASRVATATVVGAAMAALLAGCGDTTAPASNGLSDGEVSADVAAISGSAIAASVESFHADELFAGVGGTETGSCTYDAVSGTHTCTATTENGLQITREYQFRDAADTPMQHYDASNTASVNVRRTVDGTVTTTTASGATWTGVTHRFEERTVTGLLGDETQRDWNGTGTSADTTSYTTSAGRTRRYAGTSSELARDVVLALPHASNPYPTSGTVTRTLELTASASGGGGGTVSRSVQRTVTVTFDGTALVPLQTGTLTCTLNLETGRVSGCVSRTTT